MKLKVNLTRKLNIKDERVIIFGCMLHTYCEIAKKPNHWQFKWSNLERNAKNEMSVYQMLVQDFEILYSNYTKWSLSDLADNWNSNIRIYDTVRSHGSRRLLYEHIPASRSNDVVVVFDMPKNDFIRGDFSKCCLVFNTYAYLLPVTCSFVECYAASLNLTVREVENVIGGSVLRFRDEKKLKEAFGYGFQIVRSNHEHEQGRTNCKKAKNSEIIYWSQTTLYLTLQIFGNWPKEVDGQKKQSIYETDRFYKKLFTRVLLNCKFGCEFNSMDTWLLKRHESKCSIPVKISCVQRKLVDSSSREWLISNDYIPDIYCNNFCVYDIETIQPIGEVEHKTVLISLAKTFGDERKQVFKRDDLSRAGLDKMMKEFTNALDGAQKQHAKEFPKEFQTAIERLQRESSAIEAKKMSVTPMVANSIKSGLRYLQLLLKLGVYGFNSERYDMPIIYPYLIKHYKDKGAEPTVIKAGSGVMRLQCFNIYFADIKRFISGGSLATFASTWGVPTPKGLFPYDEFKTITQMKECRTWPTFDKFVSCLDLNKHSPVKDPVKEFQKAFNLAREHDDSYYINNFRQQFKLDKFFTGLPDDNADLNFADLRRNESSRGYIPVCPKAYLDNWIWFKETADSSDDYNMFEHFAKYCGLDAEITRDAFLNYTLKFQQEYKVNPLECMSLPSVASTIIWKMYDSHVSAPYSFGPDHVKLNTLLRSSLRGGLACCFQRHCEIGNTQLKEERKYVESVYSLPNGQPNKTLVSLDFNSE